MSTNTESIKESVHGWIATRSDLDSIKHLLQEIPYGVSCCDLETIVNDMLDNDEY